MRLLSSLGKQTVGTGPRRFYGEQQGGVAVTFGLSGMVLLGLVGGGIDYARISARRSQLQNALDSAVLAAGNTFKLANASADAARSVAEQSFKANINASADRPLNLQVTVPDDRSSILAIVAEDFKLAFGAFVGISKVHLTAKSQASVVGKMRLCMLTLDPSAQAAFDFENGAQVTAYGCALYSNSNNQKGMLGKDQAIAVAQTICSAGGFDGAHANFSPSPQTGCPVISDPLKGRPAPQSGSCVQLPASARKDGKIHLGDNKVETTITLDPGTYCGGLHITGAAIVTLRGGTYIMKDGPLIVDGQASLTGVDVAFYVTGRKGGMMFDKDTSVSLSAPTTGDMAGFLISEEPWVNNPVDPPIDIYVTPPPPPPKAQSQPMRLYRILSNNTRTMLGTIYLPAGRLLVDADRPVADQSSYTVVVAQQVALYKGPNLYLNTNYDGTSVPVPKGVGPTAGKFILTQ